MARGVQSSTICLNYPVYAAEFDPLNRGYLLVGGGGGEGKNGVANKLTLLNVGRIDHITVAGELELAYNEDNVTCLANANSTTFHTQTTYSFYTLAGINSSLSERLNGINQHFRTFKHEINYSGPASSDTLQHIHSARIEKISQTSLFSTLKDESSKRYAYQRIIRIARKFNGQNSPHSVGIVVSSMAKSENELVLFNTILPNTRSKDGGICEVISRFKLSQIVKACESDSSNYGEIEDVDVIESNSTDNRNSAINIQVSVCSGNHIFFSQARYDIRKKHFKGKPLNWGEVLSTRDNLFGGDKLYKFRMTRFLMKDYLLIYAHTLNREINELLIVKVDSVMNQVVHTSRFRLPRKLGFGLTMDVCVLPEAEKQSLAKRQYIVGISGQNLSISLLTMDFLANGSCEDNCKVNNGSFTRPQVYMTFNNAHANSITSISMGILRQDDQVNCCQDRLMLASVSFDGSVCVRYIDIHQSEESIRDRTTGSLTFVKRPILIPIKSHVLYNKLFLVMFIIVLNLALLIRFYLANQLTSA